MTLARAAAERSDAGRGLARGMAKWLCLAATPTFAIMALLTAVPDGTPMETLCSTGPMAMLRGMAPMYLLMSAFHAPPWMRLISSRFVGR